MTEAVLDANILLRYLTDEPRDLADRVATMLQEAERRRVSLVLAPLTLAEVVCGLESVYSWDRKEIGAQLINLVSAAALTVLDQRALIQALEWYRDVAGLDFADAYVAALAVARGHGRVVSFDRHLRRLPGISPIQSVADTG